MVFFFFVVEVSAILPWSWLSLAFPCVLVTTSRRGHVSALRTGALHHELATPGPTLCHGSPWMTKPLIRTSTSRWQHMRDYPKLPLSTFQRSPTYHNSSSSSIFVTIKRFFSRNVAIKESEKEPKLQKPPWPKALREGYLKVPFVKASS